MSFWKDRINQAFSSASESYALNASLQRATAEELANKVTTFSLPPKPRVMEIGCGTGFLTEKLCGLYPESSLVITDISLEMLATCRHTFGTLTNAHFLQMDGESPTVDGPFDLICANMTFQWFEDLSASVTRLLDLLGPNGILAYTTLCRGSLVEWQEAHSACGYGAGTPDYPTADDLKNYWPENLGIGCTDVVKIKQIYPNAVAFARAIKGIGAETSSLDHQPLSAGSMRSVLRHLDRQGNVSMTYRVAYAIFQKNAKP